jgi:tRNA1(Val) A37 N6-methylase TrmN6
MTTDQPDLQPGERIDSLGVRDWQIIQSEAAFRFSIDAVLLAYFATVNTRTSAIDLGAGTGAIALFLLARGIFRVSGVDSNPGLVEMATRTAVMNGLSERLNFVCSDVKAIRSCFSAGVCDLVITNPPYRSPASGRISPVSAVAQARHETTAGLQDFVSAAEFLLRNRGRLAMIHLPERLTDICIALRTVGLEPKRMRFVHSFHNRPPKMVLIEAVKGVKPGLAVMPPLSVYHSPGEYSREILDYYR